MESGNRLLPNPSRGVGLGSTARGLPLFVILVLLLAAIGVSASATQSLVGRKVFIKYNLIFPGTPPKVYADEIVFLEGQTHCQERIWDFVIGRGEEVKIVSVADEGPFFRIAIGTGEFGNRDVLLAKSENGDFESAFNRAFSLNAVEDARDDRSPLTVGQLIEWLGYPIYKCRKGGYTFYYYNEGFVGHRISGFHDIWFKTKAGKVIESGGLI